MPTRRSAMSQPPPFVLPPDGLGSRVRAMLAGAARQRVAVALLALAALVGGGLVWARAAPRLAGPTAGPEAVAPADQTLPRAAPDTSATPASSGQVAVHVAGRVRPPRRRPRPRRHPSRGGRDRRCRPERGQPRPQAHRRRTDPGPRPRRP